MPLVHQHPPPQPRLHLADGRDVQFRLGLSTPDRAPAGCRVGTSIRPARMLLYESATGTLNEKVLPLPSSLSIIN